MKMIINGKHVDASNGAVVDIINPATGEVIDTVPDCTKEDVLVRLRRNGPVFPAGNVPNCSQK